MLSLPDHSFPPKSSLSSSVLLLPRQHTGSENANTESTLASKYAQPLQPHNRVLYHFAGEIQV